MLLAYRQTLASIQKLFAAPSPTSFPTKTATQTPTPTSTLAPEIGTKLNPLGMVTFSLEAMSDAARYQLQFTFPSGQLVSFSAKGTSKTYSIEFFLARSGTPGR